MKIVFLYCIIILGLYNCKSQTEKSGIDVAGLVKIIETGDFNLMKNMVDTLGYQVLDSSNGEKGSLFYITKEMSIHGNGLACWADSNFIIQELTFTTGDKTVYKDIKSQLKKLGFYSKGPDKRPMGQLIETEDFRKKDILVGAGIQDKGEGWIVHEFNFLRSY